MDKPIYVIIGINIDPFPQEQVIDTWGYYCTHENAVLALSKFNKESDSNKNVSFVIREASFRV